MAKKLMLSQWYYEIDVDPKTGKNLKKYLKAKKQLTNNNLLVAPRRGKK